MCFCYDPKKKPQARAISIVDYVILPGGESGYFLCNHGIARLQRLSPVTFWRHLYLRSKLKTAVIVVVNSGYDNYQVQYCRLRSETFLASIEIHLFKFVANGTGDGRNGSFSTNLKTS